MYQHLRIQRKWILGSPVLHWICNCRLSVNYGLYEVRKVQRSQLVNIQLLPFPGTHWIVWNKVSRSCSHFNAETRCFQQTLGLGLEWEWNSTNALSKADKSMPHPHPTPKLPNQPYNTSSPRRKSFLLEGREGCICQRVEVGLSLTLNNISPLQSVGKKEGKDIPRICEVRTSAERGLFHDTHT